MVRPLLLATLCLVVGLSHAFQLPSETHRQSPRETILNRMMAKHCDYATLEYCNSQYIGGFLFGKMPVSVTDMRIKISKWVQTRGVPGYEKYCWFNNYYLECLGSNEPLCVNPSLLQAFGWDTVDAYNFVEYVGQIKYECAAGPSKVVIDNWACMVMTGESSTYGPAITNCTAAFEKALKPWPGQDKACVAGQEFATCFGAPMGKACGKAVGSEQCELIAANLHAVWPTCGFKCS